MKAFGNLGIWLSGSLDTNIPLRYFYLYLGTLENRSEANRTEQKRNGAKRSGAEWSELELELEPML